MGWEGKRDGFDVMGFESRRDGEGEGDGDDVMRRDAMPCHEVGVDQLWLVTRRPSTMARCSAACSSVFDNDAVFRCSLVGRRQWRGDPLLARRLRSVFIIILSSFIIHNCSSFINIYHSL